MGTPNYKNKISQKQATDKKVTIRYLSGYSIEKIQQQMKLDQTQVVDILTQTLLESVKNRTPGRRLNFKDRRFIEFFHQLGWNNTSIAKKLHCSPTTVKRELGRCDGDYRASQAQKNYDCLNHCKRGPKKLEASQEFLDDFCRDFKNEKKSPEAFVYETTGGFSSDTTVCFKTIYSYIHDGRLSVKDEDLPEFLPPKEDKFHQYEKENGKHTKGQSIEDRPLILRDEDNRIIDFGNWELDCLLGKKGANEPAIMVLLEKKTHYVILSRLAGHNYGCVHEALLSIYHYFGEEYNQVFKTITTDNGSEFLELAQDPLFSPVTYFCHPKAPKEKPQVERINKHLRLYFPKGKSLMNFSEVDISFVEDCENSHYRRSLGKNCAQNLFDEELDQLYCA